MSTRRVATRAAEDLISGLSDDIICRILRFIPTKDAVKTGILSKRWIHLWRSIPILNFTNINLENRESILRFNRFVYSVLLSREVAGSHTFYLDLHYFYPNHIKSLSIPNLTTWVNLVVQRGVKYLHLLLHLYDENNDDDHAFYANVMPPKFPNSIFSCKTLVVLKLKWFNVMNDFSFSSVGFEFPLLTTLHMKNIRFPEDRDFMLLLAACPILEDLNAYNIYFYLEAENPCISQEFKSLSFSKLIRADIAGCNCEFPMKPFSYSEFLRIRLTEEYNPYDFPTFGNLTHLVLNYDWDVVIEVLHHCPNLQHLDLYQKIQRNWLELMLFQKEQESWVVPEFAPQCLSLCLRTCTIRDFAFAGLQHHIMLARYILQNSRVLQTMTIWTYKELSRTYKEQPEIERELSSCPRASETCQLLVY